jgi:hypothetical protein
MMGAYNLISATARAHLFEFEEGEIGPDLARATCEKLVRISA